MKRTLSLVLALVMLLGTIPAFAADTAAEQAAFLEEMGVLKGNTAGDLMLAAELKREDSVVMLARLLGLEAAAEAWEGAPTWTDLPENPYYVSFLAWAQEEGYYKGHSDLRFGFGETITANDFALVLWRALGYEDPAVWTDAFDAAVELGLLEGLDLESSDKLLRGDMAVMVYLALGTEMAEGGKTLAEELGVEMPGVEMTLAATGAKKLTVTFNKAVEGATFAVTKGTVAVNLDGEVKWSEDGKVATITTVSNLTKGEYTVTVAGVADEAVVLKVTVEDVKLADIVIAEKAPMTDLSTNANKADLVYTLLNQYGETMSSLPGGTLNWTTSTGQVPTIGSGKITLNSTNPFIPGTKVFVNAVYTNTTAGYSLVKNAEVEIVLPAQVDEVVFAGFVKNTNPTTFVAIEAGYETAGLKLLFTVNDQYGNAYTGDLTNKLVFVSNNPLFIQDLTGFGTQTIGGVDYFTVNVNAPSGGSQAGGAVTISAISQQTGKISTYNTEANALSRVNSFTMSIPDRLIAGTDTNVVIPFEALDQYGNSVTRFSVLKDAVTLTAPDGYTLAFAQNNDGSARVLFNPASNNSDYDRVAYVSSSVKVNGNFSNLMLTIRPDAEAKVVVNLKPAIVTSIAYGNTLEIKGSDILVQDQYGRNMNSSSNPFPADYVQISYTSGGAFDIGYTESTSGSIVYDYNSTTGAIKVIMTEAADKITITANDSSLLTKALKFELVDFVSSNYVPVEGSARSLTFTKVAQSAYASYEVADLGLVYAVASGNHEYELEVYGVMSNGTKVRIPSNLIDVTSANLDYTSSTGLLVFTTDSGLALVKDGVKVNATKNIIVSVEDKDTGSTAAILEKEVVFSNKANIPTEFVLASTVTNGSAFIKGTSTGAIGYDDMYSFVTQVWDQYGYKYDPIATPTSITITNLVKVNSSSTIRVDANQTNGTSIANAKPGDKFTATLTYSGGNTVVINFTVSSTFK